MNKKYTPDEDLQLLHNAVQKAGEIALEASRQKEVKNWLKNGHEPVTEIDLKVNDYLNEALTTPRPGYGWLSEESVDNNERLTLKHVWVVDPIDGTRALLKGGKDFSICVALLEDGKPVIAAIYAPARGEFFQAQKNSGATLNNTTIHVSETASADGMRLQGDDSYFDRPKRWQSPWMNITYGKYQSFALRIAAVAAGKFDAAISARPKSEWDVAAADLIVTEAGGVCFGLDGGVLSYNNENTQIPRTVATNHALKDQINEKLNGLVSKNTS